MPLTFQFDTLEIDPVVIASEGNAVLGIRNAGKTMTAQALAEQMFLAGIPFTVFDPIGQWRFLRQPGAGRGYPVVVAGGQHGDIPLTPATAPDIVRAAMQSRVSLVIDLYDMKMSKADWRRIVESCVRVMLYENGPHGLRHIFIEESAEFCPQRPSGEQGMVYAEIEKLARMGRNARLGYTLINQRPEEIAKSVLELCDNLFLHRQKGRHSITALSKWLDAGNVGDFKAIANSLSTLPTGECWAWMAGSDTPVRIKVPMKTSATVDARQIAGDGPAAPVVQVDASAFVKKMLAALPKIEVSQPRQAGKTVAAANARAATLASTEAVVAALTEGHVAGYKKGHAEGIRVATAVWRERLAALTAELQAWSERAGDAKPAEATIEIAAPAAPSAPPAPKKPAEPRVDGALGPAATRLLAAFARYPIRGLTWSEACIVAGMIPGNGYFYGGRKELLASNRLLELEGDRLAPPPGTGGGSPLTRADFKRIWGSRKQPAPRMFDALCEAAGCWVSKEELAATTGIKPGNGFWYGGLSQLRDAGLIEDDKERVRVIDFIGNAARG